jgi:arylsulfatase
MKSESPASAEAPRNGDRLAYRFIDHMGEAALDRSLAALETAYGALRHPTHFPSPYSGLRGGERLRLLEVAFADADVAHYGKERSSETVPLSKLQLDPVWNRTRAVYESKTALFAPTPSRYSFDRVPPGGGLLRFSFATAPRAQATFVISADGKEIYRRSVRPSESGLWHAAEVEVPPTEQITFATEGPTRDGAAFFGHPVLVARGAGSSGPNVLFVVIDTLRADALPVMPRLQKWTAGGAHFSQAITAATWTRPSLLALFGGDLPSRLGHSAEEMIPSDQARRLFYSTVPPLLPRLLADRGYTTSAIGNNFFLLGYPQIGLSFGFDEVADIRHPVLDTPAIARAATAFVAAHKREPFFLYLHFDAPHWPYTPPKAWLDRIKVPPGFPEDAMARSYLAEAAYADDAVGSVLDELKRLELDRKTLVVIVGDHGEIFDHAHEHTVVALNQPTLHHHGWSAYDEVLRVPLLLGGPGVPEAQVAAQVSTIDVLPTLVELLGLTPLTGRSGRSLLPLLRKQDSNDRPAFTEGQNVRSLRAEGWLLLRRRDGRLRLGDERVTVRHEELYQLARDPLQHQDRIADSAAPLGRLRSLFDQLAPSLPKLGEPVFHLMAERASKANLLEVTITTAGTLSLRTLADAELIPTDAHMFTAKLHGGGSVEWMVEPPDAEMSISLLCDGDALPLSRLLVGPYALPYFAAEGGELHLNGDRLTWLDAPRPPMITERGGLLLWRDDSATSPLLTSNRGANQEVAGMMQKWGYSQPKAPH